MNSFLNEFRLKNAFSEKFFKRSFKEPLKREKQEKTLVQDQTNTLILLRFYIEKFLRVGFVGNAGATPYCKEVYKLNVFNKGILKIGRVFDGFIKTLKDIKNTFKYRLMLAKNMKNNKKNYK